ncbi:MAG: type II secretion system protein [Planctomycetes bacterium]|nr:type II secretion system protein [Planctomycetota bacterium]
MSTPHVTHEDRGFTLVELLIVVIILGILAGIVIPTFNNASAEAKESSLASDLATIRQAISLFRVQHNEVYPGGFAGDNWADFVSELTSKTYADGSSGGPYGPYIREMPKNPINGSELGVISTPMPAGPSGTEGYYYDPTNGEIRANVTGAAPSGTAYWDL